MKDHRRRGGILAESNNISYRHVPSPALTVVGPLIGLAYIIYLPIFFCLSIVYLFISWVGLKLKTVKHPLVHSR